MLDSRVNQAAENWRNVTAGEIIVACHAVAWRRRVSFTQTDPELDKFIMEKREARAKALAEEAQPTLFAGLK